jgi:hypothetical protein
MGRSVSGAAASGGRDVEQQLILDRYRPLEELGEGGYGTVVLAWDTRIQRRVAIKRMRLPVDSRGRPVANPPGLAEARTAAMLNHPSIVTVFDFETDQDEAFLIMEHVDGASLERVLDDLGDVLDLDEMAAVFSALADALIFAHDNGVLHLDIKPANVLITRDGRVKVADFGMAALSSAMGHGASAGGTIGYMPLEQLEGLRVSETADEWGLAALTFECLTAENPFDDNTVEAAIIRLETLDTPLPSELAPALPDAIDDVLLAALGLRPADRYPDVAAFADALEPHLGDAAAGRDSLAEMVQAYATDEGDTRAPSLDELGLWDRLSGRAGGLLVRAVAAVESGWFAWAGLTTTQLDRLGLLGAVSLIALAGALAPALGIGLGLAAFAIGLFFAGAPLLGAGVTVAWVLWWWFAGRKSTRAATIPLAAPVLGVVHLAPMTPLLAGFSLPVFDAAVAAVVAGILSVLASAASFNVSPYASVDPRVFVDLSRAPLVANALSGAFAQPATYVVLMGWVAAAAIMSWFCSKATRLMAMVGALLATTVMGGAYVLADLTSVASGSHSVWVSTELVVSVSASLTMVLLVAALGAPVRPEEDIEPE